MRKNMFGFTAFRHSVAPWICLLLILIVPASSGAQQEVQEDAQTPTELEVRRELNRLLEEPTTGVPAAIKYLDSVLDKYPTDSDLYLMAVSLNASHGVQQLSEDQVEAAHVAIRRAESFAKTIVADPKHLLAAEVMFADVFFLAAQTYATDKNSKAMYAAFDQACDLGFERWSAIPEAKPFSEYLTEPEFQAYLEKQKSLVPGRIAARLKTELETFQSFEFDFNLTSVTGEPVTKNQWHGKVLVVDVWGTWCPPCRVGLPHLVALQETYGPKGVQVVGLNSENDAKVADQAERVKAAIKEFHLNYPCALIDDALLETIPDMEGFPTTLLIDRNGRVRLKMVGAQSESRLKIVVELLLEEASSQQP